MTRNKRTKNRTAATAIFRSKTGCLAILFLAGLTYLSQHHVFFWDTIQFAGKHGQWFFDQDFTSFLLPESIDSGHPPVFGWYLALLWKVFGKSLVVSHWAMFPFLIGIVWQLLRLGRFWFKNISPGWLLWLVLLDPVFLGQSVLVSPDMVLLFFFLLALNQVEEDHFGIFAVACLGMVMISTRGMMIVAALGLYQLITAWPALKGFRWPVWWAIYQRYLPAAIFSFLFLWIHYQQTGWIGYHPDSPWAPHFERVGFSGFFRNLVIFAWRWLDYGRFFLWFLVAYLLYRNGTVKTIRNRMDEKLYPAFLLLLCISGLLSISFLLYQGLHAHRYLLPAFLVFSLCLLIMLDRLKNARLRQRLLPVLLLALFTGNGWIYPERIAQGWDATLAHWPYYPLREDLLDFLKKEEIPLAQVGAAFPDIGPLNDRDLSGRMEGFKAKDLSTDNYIFYSNIMNDFTDAEIAELHQEWEEVLRLQKRGVFVILFRRP